MSPHVASPAGDLFYRVTGTGAPVTVFAHGLGASIEETRPLGSGVRGSRVFFAFRGHGESVAPERGYDFPSLADDLTAVADAVGATRALGVSMGAGALCTLLARDPARFDKLVFFLPAMLDEQRDDQTMGRLEDMAVAVDTGDVSGVAEALRAELPEGVRDLPESDAFIQAKAQALVHTPVSHALRAVPSQVPLLDRAALAAVQAPALVIGQQGDKIHPPEVAEELAAVLPRATLHVFSEAGALWVARRRLRELISGFLNDASPGRPTG